MEKLSTASIPTPADSAMMGVAPVEVSRRESSEIKGRRVKSMGVEKKLKSRLHALSLL